MHHSSLWFVAAAGIVLIDKLSGSIVSGEPTISVGRGISATAYSAFNKYISIALFSLYTYIWFAAACVCECEWVWVCGCVK